MTNRYFEYVSGNHSKFWEVIRDETVVNVRFGRIGTQGQTQVKTFAKEFLAEEHVQRLIREKINKGYKEIGYKASGAAAQKPLSVPTPKPPVPLAPKAAAPKPVPAPPVRRRGVKVSPSRRPTEDDKE